MGIFDRAKDQPAEQPGAVDHSVAEIGDLVDDQTGTTHSAEGDQHGAGAGDGITEPDVAAQRSVPPDSAG